jgi:predicted transcriptional regulator
MTRSIRTREYAYLVEHLRNARDEAGLTQADVAKKMKRPQPLISNVEPRQKELMLLNFRFLQRSITKKLITL